jgi:signal transduction histidine kinase
VGPRLAALTLNIATARNRFSHDPAADDLFSDLVKRAHEAVDDVDDVRRSVRALRPPILDELFGLVPALRETAAQYGGNALDISVRAPEGPSAAPGGGGGGRLRDSAGGDDQRRAPRGGAPLRGGT